MEQVKGMRAAGLRGIWRGTCSAHCWDTPGLPVAVCFAHLTHSSLQAQTEWEQPCCPLPARPTGAAPQSRERSPRLREVLFPPFPFPFKAPGKAVWFLSELCRALKWGHSGSLINPVQLSLHPWLHIVLGPSPPPQCLLRQLNICLKTGCQKVVLAKPHFPSGCMYSAHHNIV